MISYFEVGNKESDTSAKSIFEWDFDYYKVWQKEIKHLQDKGNWKGLCASEAEIIAGILLNIKRKLSEIQ